MQRGWLYEHNSKYAFHCTCCMVCYFTIFTSERCAKYQWKRIKEYSGKKGKQLIDVRTVGEYRGNHMKGFQNIPLNELASRAGQLDKNMEVIVICQSGMRSKQAAKMLKKLGFQQVINVSGGMNAL